uniref:Uncharacterized protein n=1 Tax=Nelumbo nucifera TaxID=4432 RepID=A0A822ZS06_NELNU|nr:TPA_asm: hypothetical protein HUJ06_017197 [Nelumbo nucifera]
MLHYINIPDFRTGVPSTYQARRLARRRIYISAHMRNKVADVPAAAFGNGGFKGRRLLPKRGQIKSRIASSAFYSIVSVFSRATSQGLHSNQEPSFKGSQKIGND